MFIEIDNDTITIRENIGDNQDEDIAIYPKDEDENDTNDTNSDDD